MTTSKRQLGDFLDEVAAETRKQGLDCPVPAAMLKVPELASCLDGSYQWSALERALSKRGVKVPAHQLSKHARGECRCAKA